MPQRSAYCLASITPAWALRVPDMFVVDVPNVLPTHRCPSGTTSGAGSAGRPSIAVVFMLR